MSIQRKLKRQLSKKNKVQTPSTNVSSLLEKGILYLKHGKFLDGEAICKKVIKLDPNNFDGWLYLGYAFYKQGFLQRAVNAYQSCIKLKPDYAKAYYNLSLVQHDLELIPEAIKSLQQTVELDPKHAPARHKLAALSGNTTDSPPQEYVIQLFDQYSSNFETHLINNLEYKIPSHLRKLLSENISDNIRLSKAIDLGCGSGISGQAFHDIVDYIAGIDISRNMLEQAQSKKIYNDLYLGDVSKVLIELPGKFNLFIATDVMIYIGKLEQLFTTVSSKACPGAYFVFSIELQNKQDFILQPSCRYAHSPKYIHKLATENHFSIVAQKQVGIRKQGEKWIPGEIYIIKKAS